MEQRATCNVQPTWTEMVRNILNASIVKCTQWRLSRCSAERFNCYSDIFENP
jgi:hypothetical protein